MSLGTASSLSPHHPPSLPVLRRIKSSLSPQSLVSRISFGCLVWRRRAVSSRWLAVPLIIRVDPFALSVPPWRLCGVADFSFRLGGICHLIVRVRVGFFSLAHLGKAPPSLRRLFNWALLTFSTPRVPSRVSSASRAPNRAIYEPTGLCFRCKLLIRARSISRPPVPVARLLCNSFED